jgi:hypothetical protein
MRIEDQIREVEAYTFDRYVSGRSVAPIDESHAARFLDDYYSQDDRSRDPNCCYAGILWFEISFLPHETPRTCLDRAKHWLERARELSDGVWEPIEERLTDIEQMLEADEI